MREYAVIDRLECSSNPTPSMQSYYNIEFNITTKPLFLPPIDGESIDEDAFSIKKMTIIKNHVSKFRWASSQHQIIKISSSIPHTFVSFLTFICRWADMWFQRDAVSFLCSTHFFSLYLFTHKHKKCIQYNFTDSLMPLCLLSRIQLMVIIYCAAFEHVHNAKQTIFFLKAHKYERT